MIGEREKRRSNVLLIENGSVEEQTRRAGGALIYVRNTDLPFYNHVARTTLLSLRFVLLFVCTLVTNCCRIVDYLQHIAEVGLKSQFSHGGQRRCYNSIEIQFFIPRNPNLPSEFKSVLLRNM